MTRQPYCYKRYFHEVTAHPIRKDQARHWLKMGFGKELVDEKLMAIESGAIATTHHAWYSTGKDALEGLEGPRVEGEGGYA